MLLLNTKKKKEIAITLTTIFYEVDEFCKYFEKEFDKKLLLGNKKRARKGKMLPSEIMTIAIFYHHSGYKNF